MSKLKRKMGFYEKYIKRIVDVVCAGSAIIIFCPLYVVVALLVKFKLGSPVLFTQERPGKDEKIFKLYKFRTMTDEKNENGELLLDEIRLTKFGRLLRSTSLDELPEVFNIIKGDMSIVGPRPLLVRYLPFYRTKERRRHAVKPGLTGLAQVKGRNYLTWDERFEYDCEYVDKITFLNDMIIIFMTVRNVLIRADITDDGKYAMSDLDDERRYKCK